MTAACTFMYELSYVAEIQRRGWCVQYRFIFIHFYVSSFGEKAILYTVM